MTRFDALKADAAEVGCIGLGFLGALFVVGMMILASSLNELASAVRGLGP